MSGNEDKAIVWQGRYIRVVVRGRWEFVQRRNITGIVGMVPVTDEGRLVLVEQFRAPLDAKVVELPAGLVGDLAGQEDEGLQDAARRELLEETGYRAGRLRRIFHGVASAGISSEQMTFFLATQLVREGPGGGDESEDITVHEVPLDQVVSWLDERQRRGGLVDLKIYSALPFCSKK